MIKLYKDVTTAYFIMAFIGLIPICSILYSDSILDTFVALFWIIACATVYQKLAIKRFNKILNEAKKTCEIEKTLNVLFGLYKGAQNKKMDLVVGLHISSFLMLYGKYSFALNFLTYHNAEAVFKTKRETSFKYVYYNNLAVCCFRIGKKEEAVNYYNIANELYNSPYLNEKIKNSYRITHQVNGLIITEATDCEGEILSLLNTALAESKDLLSQVSTKFSIVNILLRSGEIEKAQEHILFIKQNGGDTVFRKCALQNDFSDSFLKNIDAETFTPNPEKQKEGKVVLISVGVAILMVGLAILKAVLC